MSNCYCGRESSYTACCKIIHLNIQEAITAEDLMRSRYSAFVLGKGDYLMKSHHSTTRPLKEKDEIVAWAKSVKWIRLEILHTTKGTNTDIEGTVEFSAFFYENGEVRVIHEKSKFVREHDCWVYLGS
ncbi:YchJ family protein [Aquimarina addita]|uniref:YchJ family protein n=1 Tax=Aquimarina addita TaxID=870485 RepID=A0ABP6UL47_9FLAO